VNSKWVCVQEYERIKPIKNRNLFLVVGENKKQQLIEHILFYAVFLFP